MHAAFVYIWQAVPQMLRSRLYKSRICSEALNAVHGARCEDYVAVWLLLAGGHKPKGCHGCTKSFCLALSLLAETRPNIGKYAPMAWYIQQVLP